MEQFKVDKFRKNNEELWLKIQHLENYVDEFNCYVAGGCFKDLFFDKKPKDIDLFFTDEKNVNKQ